MGDTWGFRGPVSEDELKEEPVSLVPAVVVVLVIGAELQPTVAGLDSRCVDIDWRLVRPVASGRRTVRAPTFGVIIVIRTFRSYDKFKYRGYQECPDNIFV